MTEDLIREIVYDSCRTNNLPQSPIEMESLLETVRDKVPAEFWGSVNLVFETNVLDSDEVVLRINYERPMTADERADRDEAVARCKANEMAYDLKVMARLKAKYPEHYGK